MTQAKATTAPRPGLRERKKAKTKAAIQQHALRLFAEQGYQQTTVDQIAEAAEVSPSTFFRYFGSKEETVLFDQLDPVWMAAFEAQPAELDVLTAMRNALRQVYSDLTPAWSEQEFERMLLAITVPELRMRLADRFGEGITMLAEGIARRVGRPADDEDALTLAGAISGVIYAVFVKRLERGHEDWAAAANWMVTADRALGQLQQGFSLSSKR